MEYLLLVWLVILYILMLVEIYNQNLDNIPNGLPVIRDRTYTLMEDQSNPDRIWEAQQYQKSIQPKPLIDKTNWQPEDYIMHYGRLYDVDVEFLLDLAFCESSLNPKATQAYPNSNMKDRGLFQINNYYHPDVSDQCAYDVECSTIWTIEKIRDGKAYLWACVSNQLI